jgi:hypothetical protein
MSAIVAVRELHSFLSVEDLAKVAACIEVTIPFRASTTVDGITTTGMDRLYEHMKRTVEDFQLSMTEKEIVELVQRAAVLANEDVGNFGSTDLAYFLDNSWMLLPELNESLRRQDYTVKEYQYAIRKMYGFFNVLDPDVVFQSFRGVPSDQDIGTKASNAARNLKQGATYIAAKLVSVSVLSAFAELTGGDAPVSLFLGDLPSRQKDVHRFDALLFNTELEETPQPHYDPIVYHVLTQGRSKETSFDVRNSPLAAYFYRLLGDVGVGEFLDRFKVAPEDSAAALKVLEALPRAAVRSVAENLAPSPRKAQILAVLDSLPPATVAID